MEKEILPNNFKSYPPIAIILEAPGKWWMPIPVRLFLLLSALLLLTLFASAQSIGCDGNAYFIQSTGTVVSTTLLQVNISSGTTTTVASGFGSVSAATPNNMGFNPTDNNLWGYAGPGTVFRISNNPTPYSYTTFAIDTLGGLPELPNSGNYNSGDISPTGILYLFIGGNDTLQKVDVNPASPTYLHYLGFVVITQAGLPSVTSMTDFAFNPVDSNIYTIINGSNKLARINPTTGAKTFVNGGTAVSGLPAGATQFGAIYFDVSGTLHAQYSAPAGNIGQIYSIPNVASVGVPAATLEYTVTGALGTNTDGARCSTSLLVLPLKLLSFTGDLNGSDAELNWKVTSEGESKNYEVDYCTDAKSFEKIGDVAETINSSDGEYNFQYNQPVGQGYYRLKMINDDGTATYSNNIVALNYEPEVSTIKLFPNPGKDWVTINGLTKESQIRLVNLYGDVLQNISVSSSSVQLNISSYPSGTYIVQITQNTGAVTTLKLNK
ncbi:MAG TPA: T9SS type A sorting domain-containing protein [Ferruginibacter sp.]|jgi:hypothetical protein|nr:T9SS type A sorting domain-containing protein [Ferruginibacter sp.]